MELDPKALKLFTEGYAKILEGIEVLGLNTKDAPILVQSFEPVSLKYMRSHGLQTRQVQLVDGNGIDFKSGCSRN